MNPLSTPWGKKPPSEPEEKVPNFLGVRNEAVRDSKGAEKFVIIKVTGIKGVPNGEYKVEWMEGSPLKDYINRLKLRAIASKSAIRDERNLGKGRLRLHYVPECGTTISLTNPGVSSAMMFQRSSQDATEIAARMGGGAKEVEIKLVR